MIVSRKITDQYNILNNITGYPDCVMSISQLLSLRQNANAVVLYPLIVNGIIRYEFTPLIISQNTSNIYLLDNNASGSLPTNFYDGTIAYSDVMTPTDSSMFCYNTNLNRFEERGISITSFIRNNIGYRYYNLSDTSGLEGVIYIPDWIENIYINDEPLLPSITVIQARFAEYYYRLRVNTTGNLVYDNSDRNKYINQTISGGPGGNYNFYNSATLFYNLSGRNGIATSIICDAPYSWVWEYSSDNTNWTTAQGPVSSSLNQNGVYAVSYDVGSESDSGSIVYMFFNAFKFGNDSNWSVWNITDSLIPIFNNDVDAYQNYITNTYVPVTIKVSYIIPDDEYTYCNLTWKKDYEPEDKNDGYTTTLLKDESVINITGLEENSTYVFKIFTSKSESPPFPYIVEDKPGPDPDPEYIDLLNQINNWDVVNNMETYGYYDGTSYRFNGNPKNYSWKAPYSSNYWNNYESGKQVYNITCYDRIRVDITGSGSSYTTHYTSSGTVNGFTSNTYYANPHYYPQDTDKKVIITRSGGTAWPLPDDSTSSDLRTAITNVRNNVKYINLYVNGVLWLQI